MRIGVIGDSAPGKLFAERLAQAGHKFGTAADAEALILVVEEDRLPVAIDEAAGFVSSGTIVMHTCLTRGAQALDALETRGAIVAAVCPVDDEAWAVDALDELGETVATLLVFEAHGKYMLLDDADRPGFVARLYKREMLREILAREGGGNDYVPLSTQQIMAGYNGEPAYLSYARRLAELRGDIELEFWGNNDRNQ